MTMSAATTTTSGALCSELSAQRGLPLIGSAGCYGAILAFELEPPWTARLVGSRASDARLDEAIVRIAGEAPGTRLLALEPRSASRGGPVRVLHAFAAAPPFSGFSRREYDVARGGLAAVLERLACGDEAGAGASEVPCATGLRDVLVCTHGSRDACCGKFGYRVYLELAALAAEGGDAPLRIWRSSHLGGHRFAPTLLDLPSGCMFGRIATGDPAAILARDGRLLERLPAIYRGRCALPEPAQIVERELWLRAGERFGGATLGWQVDAAAQGWRVRVEARLAPSDTAALDAEVVRAEVEAVLTPASCGRDPESEAPWRIVA